MLKVGRLKLALFTPTDLPATNLTYKSARHVGRFLGQIYRRDKSIGMNSVDM